MRLKDLDLNLLIVLNVLLEEQHVTRAARRLELTQSSVSNALKRLRLAFNDELMVLVGRKMQLTPRAEALKPRIAALITEIEQTVTEETFNPLKSDRKFVIATADYTTFILVPSLLLLLEREAPNIQLQILDIGDRTLSDMLLGKVDAIIAPRSHLFSEGLRSRSLFTEKLVCIAARNHPAIRGKIDLQTFQKLPHVRYQPGRNTPVSAESMQLKKRKITAHQVLTCPSFAALPFLVGATWAIALVQERLAQKFQKTAALQILPPPMRTEVLDIALFWTPVMNGDASHSWFRDAVARASSVV